MPASKAQTTRQLLCETAMEIAARDGLQSMTLDNLARTAGVSKGGVMHHFPSKDRLIEAVVEHFGHRLEQMILELVANDPNPRLRWARAFVDCTFLTDTARQTAPRASSPASKRTGRAPRTRSSARSLRPPHARDNFLDPVVIDRFFLAVLSVASARPALIAPLRELGQRIQQRLLADPADGLDQLLIWLALDGLLLWQFAGLLDRHDPLFERIGRELRKRLATSGAVPPRSRSKAATASGRPPARRAVTPKSGKRRS